MFSWFKKAFTLSELLITATVMIIVMAMVLPNLNRIMPDSETIRFKKVYTSIVNVISTMLADARVYPDFRGFADTSRGTDALGDSYEGDTKFADFFISKLNVIDDNFRVSAGSFPYGIVYSYGAAEEKTYTVAGVEHTGTYRELIEGLHSASNFPCVKVNTGEIFCLPPRVDVLDELSPNSDNAIYVRVYMQDKDFSEEKAFYVAVRANGKVSLPTKGNNFNCKVSNDAGRMRDANFNQCKAAAKLSEI